MTERKLTDEEIIKAMGFCKINSTYDGCRECLYVECPTQKGCVGELMEDAIDLINRRNAEIESFKKILHELKMEAEMVYKQRDMLKNQVNRQKAEIDILVRKHDTLLDEIAEKDAEIERLQNKIKEMTEGQEWA